MFIASNHKITTPNRDVFGNVLDGMPEWMVIIGNNKLVFFYQSNYVTVKEVEKLRLQLTCMTGAFMFENFGLVDPYEFCGEEKVRRALPTPGRLACLASCTFWKIEPEDKIELESVVFRPCLHYTELLHELVEFYTRKNEHVRDALVTIRRFYHPNAPYTQPLPEGYVSDTVRLKEEFLSLDWVKKFTSNHEDKDGNRFVFKKMEVVLDDAYPDFDDLEIKCGCFAVFEAPNAIERRFIGSAENEYSTDKFFEWFATPEEQNEWKVRRLRFRSRLADAADIKLKDPHLDQSNKTPIRKEILERKFEPGESAIVSRP